MTTRTLHYRPLEDADRERASALVARVFHECIAPLYSAEGVSSFEDYIKPTEFRKRRHDHFALLAEAAGDIAGLIEVKEYRQITLLFVEVMHQRQGIGRELVHRAVRLCRRRRPGLRKIEVSASPNAVAAYEKMGFTPAGPELELEGIRFLPMQAPLPLPEDHKMETKADNPAGFLEKDTPPLIAVYFELCHLKQLFRQGWRKRGVPRDRCESVADHCFGVAVLAMFVTDEHFPELDAARVMRLALLHDFGEIYAGDITPDEGISEEEKLRQERYSAAEVLGRLPHGVAYLELWEELQAGRTPEARLVREIDKLEMALQANVYERSGLADLGEFYDSARKAMSSPVLKEMLVGSPSR